WWSPSKENITSRKAVSAGSALAVLVDAPSPALASTLAPAGALFVTCELLHPAVIAPVAARPLARPPRTHSDARSSSTMEFFSYFTRECGAFDRHRSET